MPNIQAINPVLRAVGIISAVAIMVSGVTFAALQSQVTLTDNTISTVGAEGFQVDNLGRADPSNTDEGFDFSALVAGGSYSDPQRFDLINSEGGPDMTVTVHSTTATTSSPVDKTQVWVKFILLDDTGNPDDPLTEEDASVAETTEAEEYTLADLETAFNDMPGATDPERLDGGETLRYNVRVRVGADAVSTADVTIDDFDLVFTGTVVDDEPEVEPSV